MKKHDNIPLKEVPMFGSITYPMKVSKALFRLGWTPESLPPAMDSGFRQVIMGLKTNGVDADAAARLLDGALQGDLECLRAVNEKSGL
ncbi:MAG: hypothetical protein ABR588_02235 [Sphingomicrobium sp.]|nr:hypothetical protein [Sphingomonadales bacterium]